MCFSSRGVTNYDSACRKIRAAALKVSRRCVLSLDNTHPDRTPAEATIMSPSSSFISLLPTSYHLSVGPSVSAEPQTESDHFCAAAA